MGRREFYMIVDETNAMIARQEDRTGSWDGYEGDAWYQKARQKSGRKPMVRGG